MNNPNLQASPKAFKTITGLLNALKALSSRLKKKDPLHLDFLLPTALRSLKIIKPFKSLTLFKTLPKSTKKIKK